MRQRLAIVGLIGLFGCQEYNLQGDPSLYAEPNPPDLSDPVQQDRIVQVTVPSVDVLWVIDNSCSMSEEQAALAENFPKFMNYFVGSGLDYHVGVISTDMYASDQKGKLRTIGTTKWIDETTTNPTGVFTQMATMGTGGSADEKGRAAIWTALVTQKDAYNAGFLREDASLSIVVISDENDYSGNLPVTLNEFTNYLLTTKVDPGMVNFSSIVGPEPSGCTPSNGYAAEAGTQYLAVTRAVGGIEWSICNEDWAQVLEQLGMQAAGLKREFFLTDVPVEETIELWVEDDGERIDFEPGTEWTYNRARNSVVFSAYVPSPLAEVFIEYELLAAWHDDAGEEAAEEE